MSCSASQIEEKRRLALEKLKSKKTQLLNVNKSTTHPNPTTASSFYNKSTSFPNKSAQVSLPSENKASSFLNALKHCSSVANRQLLRDAAHPYQRPSAAAASGALPKGTKPSNNTPKKLAPVFVQSISCRVYMISKNRFTVEPSSYFDKLIQVFKQIPSRSYDPKTRNWNFEISDYNLVQQHVNDLNPAVVIGAIPKFVLQLCVKPQPVADHSCLTSIEPTLSEKLLPFQKEGVCFAISQGGRIMICDEMGLGKTYQALAIADYYRESWPLLICTTASTRDSWSNHIRQLLPLVQVHYIQILANNQQYIGDAKVLITSYSMMERHCEKLLERKFGFIIFDESHVLKSNKAKCTTVAGRLVNTARHVVLLSGTPALSRPLELFTQLQLIDRKFMSYKDYTFRYCDGKQTNFGWDANGQSNLEELNVLLKLKYMLRRTKAEVLPDMAEKFRETVVLDPALVWTNDETKTTIDSLNKSLSESKGKEHDEILLRFYAKTAEVKTRAVCAYLKTLVKEQDKFIVFAHHRVMMDAICDCLDKIKTKYVRIDGKTKSDLRAECINDFQNKTSCKVAVLSLKACNAGITLTAADMIVFAELDWNPSTLAQAESRAHRIGQEKPVICRYLMASNTADDTIWIMLKRKQEVLKKTGVFCEDLQNATHSAAPTMSNKIENYFSPNKSASLESKEKSNPVPKLSKTTQIDQYFSPQQVNDDVNKLNVAKAVTKNNINDKQEFNEFFEDDDDEVFKDLQF